MRRDDDLIREILLNVERLHDGAEIGGDLVMPDETPASIGGEHLVLLMEAELIRAWVDQTFNDRYVRPDAVTVQGLTWAGHEFLASIRNDTVWAKTKERTAKIGGSVSISTLSDVASAVARNLLGL